MDKYKTLEKKNPGFLFLQGVFKEDCKGIEDIFQERLLLQTSEEQRETTEVRREHKKVPLFFSSVDEWPKETDILCWYCHRSFKGVPWFEPQAIEPSTDQKKNKKVIPCKGIFCSCHCVRAFIEINTKELSEKVNKLMMLNYVYEIFTKKKVLEILPSPSPYEMYQYGGSVSPEEYETKIRDLDTFFVV